MKSNLLNKRNIKVCLSLFYLSLLALISSLLVASLNRERFHKSFTCVFELFLEKSRYKEYEITFYYLRILATYATIIPNVPINTTVTVMLRSSDIITETTYVNRSIGSIW